MPLVTSNRSHSEIYELICVIVNRDRDLFHRTAGVEESDPKPSGALIPNQKRPTPATTTPITTTTKTTTTTSTSNTSVKINRYNERAALEIRLKEQVLTSWGKLENLKEGMEEGKQEHIDQWIKIAKTLIEEFKSIKSFFPYEKGKRITWYDDDFGGREFGPLGPRKRRKYGGDGESRIEETQARLLLENQQESTTDNQGFTPSLT